MGIALDPIERSEPIQFIYDTPVSSPTHDFRGVDPVSDSLEAEADAMLVFGMLETRPRVSADRLVIDPQSPGLTQLDDHVEWTADRLAIVGNLQEIRGLADTPNGPAATAAEIVRSKYGAEVVVVKCGPRGALLVEQSGATSIPPYRTDSVWPIGSGDVFSALFAWSWAERGAPALDAAMGASMAAASWCARPPLQVVNQKGDLVPPPTRGDAAPPRVPDEASATAEVRIYLAGPYFNYGERWLVDLMREALSELGAEVFSPFHDVGTGPPSAVAPADIRGLEDSHAVLALLDGLDAGTLFEVGYARARSIPVVGFSANPTSPDLTMLIGTDVPVCSDLASAAYNVIWAGLS